MKGTARRGAHRACSYSFPKFQQLERLNGTTEEWYECMVEIGAISNRNRPS